MQADVLMTVVKKAPQTEIRSLTGLRGVAAIYVVFYHATGGLILQTTHFNIFLSHGYLAVDLFFVLSGFVMAMNYKHMFASEWSVAAYLKFLGRRVARMYPLYFACTLVGFMISWRDAHPPPGLHVVYPIVKTLLLNLLMIQVWGFRLGQSLDPPAWSISAECAAYLLFPLLLLPTLFRKAKWGWLAAIAGILLLVLLCNISALNISNSAPTLLLNLSSPTAGLAVVRCVSEFVMGLVAFRVASHPFSLAISSSRWIAASVCGVTLLLLTLPRSDIFVALLFPFVILCISSGENIVQWTLSTRPAELLGILSYSIYLTHELMNKPTFWLASEGKKRGIPHAHFALLLLLLVVAWLANRLIEVPCRRWLRDLFEGHAPYTPLERPASLN